MWQENVREKKNVRIVPQPKTTLDKIGDIFEQVTEDGPALLQQLGEEFSKAYGEGQQVLAGIPNQAQQTTKEVIRKARKIEQDLKEKEKEWVNGLGNTASQFGNTMSQLVKLP